jgi:hypothetical protein
MGSSKPLNDMSTCLETRGLIYLPKSTQIQIPWPCESLTGLQRNSFLLYAIHQMHLPLIPLLQIKQLSNITSWLRNEINLKLFIIALFHTDSPLVSLPLSTTTHPSWPRPPHWHHSAFHDVRDSVRSDVRPMLHSRAEVSLQYLIIN